MSYIVWVNPGMRYVSPWFFWTSGWTTSGGLIPVILRNLAWEFRPCLAHSGRWWLLHCGYGRALGSCRFCCGFKTLNTKALYKAQGCSSLALIWACIEYYVISWNDICSFILRIFIFIITSNINQIKISNMHIYIHIILINPNCRCRCLCTHTNRSLFSQHESSTM